MCTLCVCVCLLYAFVCMPGCFESSAACNLPAPSFCPSAAPAIVIGLGSQPAMFQFGTSTVIRRCVTSDCMLLMNINDVKRDVVSRYVIVKVRLSEAKHQHRTKESLVNNSS